MQNVERGHRVVRRSIGISEPKTATNIVTVFCSVGVQLSKFYPVPETISIFKFHPMPETKYCSVIRRIKKRSIQKLYQNEK